VRFCVWRGFNRSVKLDPCPRQPPPHTAMTIDVRQASIADADRLSRFGAATFRETFEGENTPDDMARYLAEAYTPARQAAEVSDPAGIVLLAEQRVSSGGAAPAKIGELVGYVHLVSGPPPAVVHGPSPLELKRLYVGRAWHGQGVAQALMDAAITAARARGAETLWLGVWERNPRAIAFYAKYGFSRVGEHTFVLGADLQTDWVLARALNEAPSIP
jgi:ribosomal protein S18 acetylase RimI-like enzyme